MTLVPTWASSGHGCFAWPEGCPNLDLVCGVATWVSPIPGDSGPNVRLLDLVNLVLTCSSPRFGDSGHHLGSPGPGGSGPIWASPSPGDFVPHLYLIALDCFLASPGTGVSDPICASPRPVDSGPHLGIIGTWLLCSTPEPHLYMMSLGPLWVSP